MDRTTNRHDRAAEREDVDAIAQRLAEDCSLAGLDVVLIAPTRVKVSRPGAHDRLSETVRCMPDAQERLMWWWSWGEPICPADQIADAVKAIAHVVTPPAEAGS